MVPSASARWLMARSLLNLRTWLVHSHPHFVAHHAEPPTAAALGGAATMAAVKWQPSTSASRAGTTVYT